MEQYVTCKEMKKIEAQADAAGLSYYQMMENAGTALVSEILSRTEEPYSEKSGAVFCGKGNNGGDGFVAARLLAEKGFLVTVILVEGLPATADAEKNFTLLTDCYIHVLDIHEIEKIDFPHADIVIDAIFGTGFHGKFNDEGLVSVYMINQLKKKAKIYSVDIPSGLNGDMVTGDRIENIPVSADYTICFHRKKPVHFCRNAKDFLGEIIVCDIGIDNI